MKRLIFFSILLLTINFCFSQGNYEYQLQIIHHDGQRALVNQLGKPFGSTTTVEGIVVFNSKGYNDGINLQVQTINDSAIQKLITIPLAPYWGKFGEGALPNLEADSTYRLRVYETGEFVGSPDKAYQEAGIIFQTTGFYFQNRLVVLSGEKINPIKETPDKFVGQIALISGIAENEYNTAFINTTKGKLRLIGFRKWKESEIGKLVEVYGKIEQTETNGTYNVRDGKPRLVKLKDQIGMTVTLRGRAINANRYWWFEYRGTDIYVEKIEELPNWTVNNHFRPIEITGILEQAVLPRLDQIGLKINRDSKLYYIIRKPGWKPIEKLLAIDYTEIEDD